MGVGFKGEERETGSTSERAGWVEFLQACPEVHSLLLAAPDPAAGVTAVRAWAQARLSDGGRRYLAAPAPGRKEYEELAFSDLATLRLIAYCDHDGESFADPNLRGEAVLSAPLTWLWEAAQGRECAGGPDFRADTAALLRQLGGPAEWPLPGSDVVSGWLERHPSGLDAAVRGAHARNRERIIDYLIDLMDRGVLNRPHYSFAPGLTRAEKRKRMGAWWQEHRFHLSFAIRSPRRLQEVLAGTLSPETVETLEAAQEAGIPFFVNPYYLSLLNAEPDGLLAGADLAIRQYVLYSRELVEEFGHISAWEKEDVVEPGKPNAAGWLLPDAHAVHRRYPEVAILIPETAGRACGGLCSSCQRMYDFQSGHLNFDLERLRPGERWPDRLSRYMKYFEEDAQLRDILITGGDALMSSDHALSRILDAVLAMAVRKREANRALPEGEKHAEMVRVRLGSRLPVYLPQRVTGSLLEILRTFREKAAAVGLRQFVIQTHFESPLEVTPAVQKAVAGLQGAGWIVTNQQVFTAAAARRGHTARLRQVLNDIGVLTYYTFTVKGHRENKANFATMARAVQEQLEEKALGTVTPEYYEKLRRLIERPEALPEKTRKLRQEMGVPFLATDRNVLNLPGVGKSLTFQTIGITQDGRRILEFDHDGTRKHSPIIEEMGRIVIVESKSVAEFVRQLESFGEDPSEYRDLPGYSLGQTEPRMPIYEYPEYPFRTTDRITNLQLD